MFFNPITKEMQGLFTDRNRLISFPQPPEGAFGKKCIIDSGTYGLYKKNKTYDKDLIIKLKNHHDCFCIDDNYILVAPDVPKNWRKTIDNFKFYKSISTNEIRPVFVFSNSRFCIIEFMNQYKFYKDYISDWVFISDKIVSKKFCPNYLHDILKMIRRIIGRDVYVHFFSAGKNIIQVQELCKYEKVSFDTTNYYFDSKTIQSTNINWKAIFEKDSIKTCGNILNNIYFITKQ